jgi:hypothetical protein
VTPFEFSDGSRVGMAGVGVVHAKRNYRRTGRPGGRACGASR